MVSLPWRLCFNHSKLPARNRPTCEVTPAEFATKILPANLVHGTDAVPKKRGPKTDVLEALLKRVDGLEAKLKEKNAEGASSKAGESAEDEVTDEAEPDKPEEAPERPPKRVAMEKSKSPVTDVGPTYPQRFNASRSVLL